MTKLGDEREIAGAIEGPLHLEYQVSDVERCGVPCIIITIALDGQDQVLGRGPCVSPVELKSIAIHQGLVG